MSERYEINVNIIEGGKSQTRNPDNISTPNMSSEGDKMSKAQAQSKLANIKETIGTKIRSRIGVDTDGSIGMEEIASGALIGIGVTTAVANFAADYIGTSYELRGADHKATKLSHTMDQVNAGAGLAGSVIAGAMVGGPYGAVIGGVVYVAKKGYDLAMSNRKFLKEIQTSTVESNYYMNRVRQDISQRR